MTEDDRWQRVRDLFEAACDLDSGQRAPYLRDACGDDDDLRREVEALLTADRRSGDGFIVGAIVDAAGTLSDELAPMRVDRMVGPYRLVKEIAHGGMGTVYLGERADEAYRTRVAIKFVRGVARTELLRRFLAERQILADLQHPNIARMLDGGAAEDGTPYLVMEFIEGASIDAFADGARLDIPARLSLFLRVCDAVQHAHRHLVVHRDIKPTNILVTEDGTPKLLDFGVAKLLDPSQGQEVTETAAGALLTPAYASPEQVRGDRITTATDVYSLGVLLYRLLTGVLPYREGARSGPALARAILEEGPGLPSRVVALRAEALPAGVERERVARQLQGDVDAIILTALAKDPARRYASVEQLAEDVRRHLTAQTIRARPDTRTYRLRKYLQRHRLGVTGTAAAVLVVLSLIAFYTARLARQRDFAERERAKASEVAGFLEHLFKVSDPSEAQGTTITAREVLDSAVARMPTSLIGQPDLQAAMLYTLGGVYANLGLAKQAEPLLRRSLELRLASNEAGSPSVGEVLMRLGGVVQTLGAFDSSAAILADAVARLDAETRGPNPAAVMARSTLVNSLRRGNRMAEADTVMVQAERDARTLGLDSIVQNVLATRGALLLAQRRAVEAEPVLREALAYARRIWGDDSPITITALGNAGQVLYQQSRFAEAEPLVRETLERSIRVRGAESPQTGVTWNNLAALLQGMGRPREAAAAARRALAIYQAAYGERHQRTLLVMGNLASMLLAMGETGEAERLQRRALAIRKEILRPGHIDIAASYNNLAHVLEEEDRYTEAEQAYRSAIEVLQQGLGIETPEGSSFLANLGGVLSLQKRYREAEPILRQALAIQRAKLPARHVSTATTLNGLGQLLLATGRPGEARPMLEEALAIRTALLDQNHWALQVTRSNLGEALGRLGQPVAAESLMTLGAGLLEARFGLQDGRVRTAFQRLLRFYRAAGDTAGAAQVQAKLAQAR